MGNQQTISSEEYDDPEFQRNVLNYLRNRSSYQSSQERQTRPTRIKYTSHEQDNGNYIVYTNNLFEAKVKRSIVKKQANFYSTFHRKLRQNTKKNHSKRFDDLSQKLDIPPSNNLYSRTMETMLPNKRRRIDEVDSSIYNIIFNADGSQLLVTTKERLHLYDEKDGKYVAGKVLNPRNITWTITDSDLSPCGRFLIHCSLNSFVSIFDLQTGKYSNFYNFNDESSEDYVDDDYWSRLRFFSCKYSGDGTKILASSGVSNNNSALIKVFDIAAERICDSIQAHDDDINSISFVNKLSSSVFISGSDDRLVKIWDTRALGSRGGQSAGILIGHVAGITHVDSRQDNFYVASNGKDSSVKLWDLRKSESTTVGKPRKNFSFDYRGHALSDKQVSDIRAFSRTQNFDNSVQTFRGHKVGGTLMRCHFSPLGPTDRRYIYTASSCGKLFIYDILTGTTTEDGADTVDFQEEKNSYTSAILNDLERSPIRDAIWHPNKMEIITTNLRGQLFRWHNNQLYQDKITSKWLNEESLEGDNNSDHESVETIENASTSNRRSYLNYFQTDYQDDDEDEEHEVDSDDENQNQLDEEEEEVDEDDDDEDYEDVEEDDKDGIEDSQDEAERLLNDLGESGIESLENYIDNLKQQKNQEDVSDSVGVDSAMQEEDSSNSSHQHCHSHEIEKSQSQQLDEEEEEEEEEES